MVSTTTYSQKCNKLIHIGMDLIVIRIVMDTGIFNLLSLQTNERIRNNGYYFWVRIYICSSRYSIIVSVTIQSDLPQEKWTVCKEKIPWCHLDRCFVYWWYLQPILKPDWREGHNCSILTGLLVNHWDGWEARSLTLLGGYPWCWSSWPALLAHFYLWVVLPPGPGQASGSSVDFCGPLPIAAFIQSWLQSPINLVWTGHPFVAYCSRSACTRRSMPGQMVTYCSNRVGVQMVFGYTNGILTRVVCCFQ